LPWQPRHGRSRLTQRKTSRRHKRAFRHEYDELLKRDKLNLDLFWIKDESLTDTASLPAPDVIAAEIADDLEAALEQFTKIAARLRTAASQSQSAKSIRAAAE
jgi:type I restriction enzyme M protein